MNHRPILLALLTLIFLTGLGALHAQSSDALKHTFLPPPTGLMAAAELGSSTAVDANFIALGAPQDDTGGSSKGVVKVFNATTGALLHVLANPEPDLVGNFGAAVALSGGRLVVSAPSGDKVYVYNLGGATPTVPVLALTTPNNAANGTFGHAVAISGLRIVVSDWYDDTGATDAGIVFVYNLASPTPSVPVAVLNNPALGTTHLFGTSVAISGTRVIASGSDDYVCLYDLAGVTPTVPLGTFINPSPVAYKTFGESVALQGTIAVIGHPQNYPSNVQWAGSAFVFDLAGATPFTALLSLNNPTPAVGDRFGNAVAVSGNRVVVGSYLKSSGAGMTFVYDITSGTPAAPVVTLSNPTPASNDYFGAAVAIFGARVLVGAKEDDTASADAGAGYVFDMTSGTPAAPVLTLTHVGPSAFDEFGSATAVSGTRVVVGSPFDDTGGSNAGIVTVHDLSGATPTTPLFTLLNPAPSKLAFGSSVAISGNLVVVGAIGGTEAAYVFDLASATPTVPVSTFTNPGGTSGDFGYSVAVSGSLVAVGAPHTPVGAFRGRVCVYDVAGTTPATPVLVVENTVDSSGSGCFGATDSFGLSVSLSGTRLVVGAPNNTAGGMVWAGQVFVYDIASTTPTQPIHVLQKGTPATEDGFGWSVSISGDRIAVGVSDDDTTSLNAGATHVFDLASATPEAPVLVIPQPATSAEPYYFGSTVALSGARLVVGSANHPLASDSTDHVHVFNLDRAPPSVPVGVLANPGGIRDRFGTSVAIDGLTLAIGAPGDDTVVADKGAAHVYGAASTITLPPTLTAPATGAIFPSSVSIQFTLPEAALPGTVKLSFKKNATPVVFTLASTEETAGAHSFTFSPTNPTASAAIASGAALPDGLYIVALSYQDTIGSYAATSNAAIIYVDHTPPSIAPPVGGFSPLVLAAPAVAPDYTTQAVATDLAGVASVTQSPAPGTALTAGANTVTLTATDFIGLSASTSFTVTVLTFTQDSDGDGLNDASELQMAALGFDWQTNQAALVNTLMANANGAGLYTTSQVQALNVGTPLITKNPATGLFKLTIGVEKSTNLQTFTPFPMTEPQTFINGAGKLDFYFMAPDNAAFFQIRAE